MEDGESDSDAAPEDIAFTSSREKALQKVRDALNQIGNEKQKLKQKRRNRDDQFREQKVSVLTITFTVFIRIEAPSRIEAPPCF